MAKSNTYVIKAIDNESRVVVEDRINAMSDRAAWDQAVALAFEKNSSEAKDGYLVSPIAQIEVTRLS